VPTTATLLFAAAPVALMSAGSARRDGDGDAADADADDAVWSARAGAHRDDLPTFTLADLQQHGASAERIWVVYKSGVYDITEWLELHPGGRTKILQAAGRSIEPFWQMYGQHRAGWVFEILEQYRIGNIDPTALASVVAADPYTADPPRDPRLIVHSLKPFNAEAPSELLVDSFLTPNELFYVRNHLPVPLVDAQAFRLTIDVPGRAPVALTLDELKRDFPKRTVTSAIQCGGNRRTDLGQVRPVKGGPWIVGAIGNAEWSGVLLRDVLERQLGVPLSSEPLLRSDGRHVHFEGLDVDESGHPYSVSVPASIALAGAGDTLLAYEMNGEPLPRDHGWPLRAIVPGVVGARQVKWLGAVRLRGAESDSLHQQRDYKTFSPSSDWDNLDWSVAPALQAMPVQSAVCWPPKGAAVPATAQGKQLVLKNVRGYAYSGGGAAVVRVDVTTDDGATWHTARLEPIASTPGERATFGWRRWALDLPVPADKPSVRIRVRAVDENYNVQPESAASIWNMRGLLNNSWHAVDVKLTHSAASK
jgi:sulfite oxidase